MSKLNSNTLTILTDVSTLDTEEKRRSYYTYHMSQPSTLFNHPRPTYIDLTPLNEELVKLAGRDRHGDPRFRIVWAPELKKRNYYQDSNGDFQPYWGKKYPFLRTRKPSGWLYINDEGNETFTLKKEDIPAEKVTTRHYEYNDLGVMKFAVEMKYDLEELKKLKYYPEDPIEFRKWGTDDRGQRYSELPSRRGEYLLCFYIETPDKEYRDVTRKDLDLIRGIYRRAENETDHEYAMRKATETAQVLALQDEAEKEELNTAIGDAIIRAEKSPPERVVFDFGRRK